MLDCERKGRQIDKAVFIDKVNNSETIGNLTNILDLLKSMFSKGKDYLNEYKVLKDIIDEMKKETN